MRLLAAIGLAAGVWALPAAAAEGPRPSAGVTVAAPNGWVRQAPDAASLAFLGPDGLSSIIVTLQDGALSSAREWLSQTIELPALGLLIPLGGVEAGAASVSGRFIASGGGPLSRAQITVKSAPAGKLIIVLGAAPAGREQDLARAIDELARATGLQSGAPATAPDRMPEPTPEVPLDATPDAAPEATPEPTP